MKKLYSASLLALAISATMAWSCGDNDDNNTPENKPGTETQTTDTTALIKSFTINNQIGDFVIGDTTIVGTIRRSVDLNALRPVIVVSDSATVEPASGKRTNFSNGTVLYTVTSANGTQHRYWVTVNLGPSEECDITDVHIEGQTGSAKKGNTYVVYMPFGSDISNLKPTITVSDSATIEPASGLAQDFSKGAINYTVTSAYGGTSQQWNIKIDDLTLPNNPNFQFMGRVYWPNEHTARLYAPGSGLNLRFKGNKCVLKITDNHLWGSYHNYLEIIIDGGSPRRYCTVGEENIFDLGAGLDDGEHTATIIKDTESGMGYIQIDGVQATQLLEPEALPTRKIEFIGNSITSGNGMYTDSVACDAGEWYDQNKASASYGVLTAKALNAQWQLNSSSGIGFYSSCCGTTFNMYSAYDKYNHSSNSIDCDVAALGYKPDVVCICLGQNDGILADDVFDSNYIKFVKKIRGYNPDAQIVCLSSPMADKSLQEYMKERLTAVVTALNEEGDCNVSTFFFSKQWSSGCSSHPNEAEHVEIAEELTPYLRTLMGW